MANELSAVAVTVSGVSQGEDKAPAAAAAAAAKSAPCMDSREIYPHRSHKISL